MKKLLLFALTLVLCLSLASCDAIQQFVSGLDLDGTGNKPPISEDEWLALVSVTNYSSEYTRYENHNGSLEKVNHVDAKYADDNKYRKVALNGEIQFEKYETIIDGVAYNIFNRQDGRGFVLETASENELSGAEPIISKSRAKEYYSSLKDAGNNTYTIEYKASFKYTYSYVIKVENGKITEMTETVTYRDNSQKLVTTYFDIGTTVVEIPEITTVSEAEWFTNMVSMNYTFEAVALNVISYGSTYDSYMNCARTEYAEKTDISTEGDINYSTSTFYALYNGVTYKIEENENGYEGGVASQAIDWNDCLYKELGLSAEEMEYSFTNLIYNEETKSYNYGAYDFYFKDGVLIKVIASYVNEEGNSFVMTFTFSNIGTTVIKVPEFTIVE